jgi:hypothetical protein
MGEHKRSATSEQTATAANELKSSAEANERHCKSSIQANGICEPKHQHERIRWIWLAIRVC